MIKRVRVRIHTRKRQNIFFVAHRQIRTVILIQSVSGLRFLIFMLKHCVCGTFAPSGPKRKPGQVVFLVGFLPLRGLRGPRNR